MLIAAVLICALAVLTAGPVFAAERLDLFDSKGRRTGYAVVDREGQRIDLFDAKSRRTGWGRITPSGRIELFGLDGRRQREAVLPPQKGGN